MPLIGLLLVLFIPAGGFWVCSWSCLGGCGGCVGLVFCGCGCGCGRHLARIFPAAGRDSSSDLCS